jgi:hypothetical protein
MSWLSRPGIAKLQLKGKDPKYRGFQKMDMSEQKTGMKTFSQSMIHTIKINTGGLGGRPQMVEPRGLLCDSYHCPHTVASYPAPLSLPTPASMAKYTLVKRQ